MWVDPDICIDGLRVQWLMLENVDEKTFSLHLSVIQSGLKFPMNFLKIKKLLIAMI